MIYRNASWDCDCAVCLWLARVREFFLEHMRIHLFLHFFLMILAYPVWWAWFFLEPVHLYVSSVGFLVLVLISELLIYPRMIVSPPGRKWIPDMGLMVHSILLPVSFINWLMPVGLATVLAAIVVLVVSRRRFKAERLGVLSQDSAS